MKIIKQYTYEEATNLIGRLPKEIYTLMDMGAGIRDNPISKQVAEIECQTLVSVEGFSPYVEILKTIPVKAKKHYVYEGKIEDFPILENCDVILIDVIEHLPKGKALSFIAEIKKYARSLLIFTPEGNTIGYSNHHMDNALQMHLSAWKADELEELGFDVEVYAGFHTHVKSYPVGAMWATWKKEN